MKHLNRRTAHLVVIRISDSSAMKELTKKTRETAAMHPDIPGAKALAELGGSPLRDPDKVDGRTFSCPGFRAVYFRLPGTKTWVLMALGSATKINLGEDDNAFVKLLSDVLTETEVDSLWVADFARLLRSVDYLSDTWRAVRTRCRYVRHAGAVIDTASPTAEIQFLFEALSAAAEARSVVMRTTRGKMRAYADEKCPLAKQSVPRGWHRNRDKKLELAHPLPSKEIRTIVQVLGNPELTDEERVKLAADAGAISPAQSARKKRPVRVDELTNPNGVVGRWYGLLDVWKTGSWVVEYELPALLNQARFDLDLDIEEAYGVRVWRMTFELPLPEGGWATEDEFAAAERLRDRRAERNTPTGGASSGNARKPFSGLPAWIHEGFQYVLLSRKAGSYELRRRPEKMAVEKQFIGGSPQWVARGWGRNSNKEGAVLARLSAKELHSKVVEGLVQAASQGLTLQSASDAVFEVDDELLDRLRQDLTARKRESANARRNANEARTEDERRKYLNDARRAQADAQELERDVLRLAGAQSGDQIPVDADAVAKALAAIADQDDHVPGSVADAFRTVIHDLQILPVDDETVRWEASLRVPLVGGTLTIGPATGQVDTGSERKLAARRNSTLSARASEAAAMVMARGLEVDDAAERLRISTTRRVAQTVRDHLKELGLPSEAASMLVAEAPAPARLVVWERVHDRPYPRGISRPYAAHIAETYLDRQVRWTPDRARVEAPLVSVISAVERRAGWVPCSDLDELCQEADISRTTLGYYASGRRRSDGTWRQPILRTGEDDGVELISCPHDGCHGWATSVVALPEVPLYLLCNTCLRMPDPEFSDVVFPDAYRSGGSNTERGGLPQGDDRS